MKPLPTNDPAHRRARRVHHHTGNGLADLSPGYFAMVMATGIVSIAAQYEGLTIVARMLFYFNVVAWFVLWVLNILRMTLHARRFFGDVVDHLSGPGFFTMVAGTAVLASQFLMFEADFRFVVVLAGLAVVLWALLTYTIFIAFTVKDNKPPLDKGISGAWLLAVVSTQSLAVLSALISARTDHAWRLELNFFALSMWLWGGMLYIWMMSLIFYRYTFFRLSPGDLTPPYWINMGAMAISTLAGSLLIENAPHAPFLNGMLPFIKGFTIFYWATGTWWIPMLLLLGIWRHLFKGFPLRYDPLYWGAVFPLGMYSASTHEMVKGLEIHVLGFLAPTFLYLALIAWVATFFGLVRHVVRAARPSAATVG